MDIDSREFIDELTKFRDAVIDHAEHEENEEFNKLQRKLDADDRERMARGGAGRRGDRTHPSAPRCRVGQAEFRRRAVRVDARPGPRPHSNEATS